MVKGENIPTKEELSEMKNRLNKIETTIFGDRGKQSPLTDELISRIFSKLDASKIENDHRTIIIIGYILIVLVLFGIILQCVFQSQLADISELSSMR